MKKNKFMRLASALLVLTLLSTCAISGTFAKYTSSNNASDSARVAKWGYGTSTVVFADLFSATYTNVNADAKVIAPGTEGNATFTFAPNASIDTEVAYKLDVEATTGSSIDSTIVANTNIQFKLDNGNWGTFEELQTAIANLSVDKVEANANDATITVTVYWKWAYETAGEGVAAQDKTDTDMGIAGNAVVTLQINVTATQLD